MMDGKRMKERASSNSLRGVSERAEQLPARVKSDMQIKRTQDRARTEQYTEGLAR